MTTHAVGYGEQARARVARILVRLTNLPDVALRPDNHVHFRISNTVLPIFTRSPR